MLWREGQCQVPGEELPAGQPPASLLPSPADHVAQRHGGHKQAEDEHELEEEGRAGSPEAARGRPGVPQEGVLGGKKQPLGAASPFAHTKESGGPGKGRWVGEAAEAGAPLTGESCSLPARDPAPS